MIRSKEFLLKNVYDIRGKKLGVVEDLYIDFFKGIIIGLKISTHAFFSKKNCVFIDDIISIDKEILVKELKEGTGLRLQEVKGMDIIDLNGNLKGVVEDCIIDEIGLTIKGLVVSTGLIERLLKGKEVILINECILGEDYVLYVGNKNVTLKSMPRKEEKNEVSN
ncbi:PRC-barrel domain-containing protein [Clostridium sp.]|uniref:PRC-barrel domain-containing protein n=1 Tax=Clostridium sp. TaxID=1506 RepID=UPI0026DD5F7C|nr:PRC-barrel domain-containing protein [Clostridium sp.]MDO5038110.1 PRC-barrel domain-containing protein [Clostridium sp.]